MITFFRKIRIQLMKENKISKYLLYAVSEIMLVVIGIYIAIQFNNWNEGRKDENAIKQVLVGVQSDLLSDMQEIKYAEEFFSTWDSISALIIDKKLTHEDYTSNYANDLVGIGRYEYPIIISDKSFQLLQNYKDKIPSQYLDIISELNVTYGETRTFMELSQQDLSGLRKKLDEFLFQQEWYVDLENGRMNEEIIDFFLNNKSYPKYIYEYRSLTKQVKQYAQGQYNNLMLSYLIIRDQISPNSMLPTQIKSSVLFNKDEIQDYSGVYEFDSESLELSFYEFHGFLMSKNSSSKDIYGQYYLMSKLGRDSVEYSFDENFLFVFKRNNDGEVIELTSNFDSDIILGKKVK